MQLTASNEQRVGGQGMGVGEGTVGSTLDSGNYPFLNGWSF